MKPFGRPLMTRGHPHRRSPASLDGLWEPARVRINQGLTASLCRAVNRGPGVNSINCIANRVLLVRALKRAP